MTTSKGLPLVARLAVVAVTLVFTFHGTHAHEHHDHHDPNSPDHGTTRLWDPTTRGSLIALDLDHTRFTALYYQTDTEAVQSWSTPVCLIDRGAAAEASTGEATRFALCPPDLDPWQMPKRIPAMDDTNWPDLYDGVTGDLINVGEDLGVRTFHQPGVGQVYTNLLQAYEHQSIFPNVTAATDSAPPKLLAIKLSSPVAHQELRQAGVADVRTFWRLAPRAMPSRDLLTPTQLLTVYLGLLLRHTSELILSSSSPLSLTSARVASVLPIVPGTWPTYQSSGPDDTSPLSALLRALPAYDGRPPTVFRPLIRPSATVHGAQLDQLAECAHRPLKALVVHRERRHANGARQFSHHVHLVNVPLSDFLTVEPVFKTSVAFSDVQRVLEDGIHADVTHVLMTGHAWTHQQVLDLSQAIPDAHVSLGPTGSGQTGWLSAPHMSSAAAILDQQYSPCSCGKRDAMVVRCDLLTRGVSALRRNTRATEMPLVVAASAPPAAPLVLPALPYVDRDAHGATESVSDYYARHFVTGAWMYLGRQSNTSTVAVHERGWNMANGDVGQCIPRADPREGQQRKHISKHRVVLGVPPAWTQVVCLNPYHVPGRVARLRENGVELVVVEWWVVDKRWFAPDLGKEDGGKDSKAKKKGGR